jgi:FdhD protein
MDQIIKVVNGSSRAEDAQVILEAPVSLTVNGEVWLTFMCTPVDLEALAIGFLYNEGLIETGSDVADLRICPSGDNIDIWTCAKLPKPTAWRRTSGCVGGNTQVTDHENLKYPALSSSQNGSRLTITQIDDLLDLLSQGQKLYRQFGGVHTSVLTDGNGATIYAEDIGRHNTLDKIAGNYLIHPVHYERKILLTTGRISSEMLQKAARIGAGTILSRTSPSTLSIQMAKEFGITLIGYARKNHFIIYTHPERIKLDPIIQNDSLQRIYQHGQDI